MVKELRKKQILVENNSLCMSTARDILVYLFTFFVCFMAQLENVFVCNALFIIIVLIYNKRFIFRNNKVKNEFLLFIVWTVVSSVAFYCVFQIYSLRNFVQWIFNIQYIFFVLKLNLPIEKIKKGIIFFSHILSLYIIFALIFTGTYKLGLGILTERLWGEKLIPGWPNGTVLPILFGIYLLLSSTKYKHKILSCGLLYVALVVTTSRTGMLGGFIIIVYFVLKNRRKTHSKILIALGVVVLPLAIILLFSNSDLQRRLMTSWDRIDIAKSVFMLIKGSPIIGFGGNSYDVAYSLFTSSEMINWGHTHNTILELLIRYGIIGLLLFLFLIVSCYKLVPKKHKFFYLFLWGISLFQIYFRNFVFIFMVIYLIQDRQDKQEKNLQRLMELKQYEK